MCKCVNMKVSSTAWFQMTYLEKKRKKDAGAPDVSKVFLKLLIL